MYELDTRGKFPFDSETLDEVCKAAFKAHILHEENELAKAIIAKFAIIRYYADELYEASRHPILGFFRLRKARRNYFAVKDVSVAIDDMIIRETFGELK